jgi:TusA-related sulfurtransferase
MKNIAIGFSVAFDLHCQPPSFNFNTNTGACVLEEKADFKLDFRDMITSMALLKLTRTFREMKANQVLEVLGLDEDTQSDLFRLLPSLSYQLVTLDEENGTPIRIQIRKT